MRRFVFAVVVLVAAAALYWMTPRSASAEGALATVTMPALSPQAQTG